MYPPLVLALSFRVQLLRRGLHTSFFRRSFEFLSAIAASTKEIDFLAINECFDGANDIVSQN